MSAFSVSPLSGSQQRMHILKWGLLHRTQEVMGTIKLMFASAHLVRVKVTVTGHEIFRGDTHQMGYRWKAYRKGFPTIYNT